MKDRLLEIVESSEQEIYSLTSSLIKIPSEIFNMTGNEGECQKYIANWFKDLGLEVDIFNPGEVKDFDKFPGFLPEFWEKQDFEDRPNVVTTVKGSGGGRSLILNGHVDVVPKEPLWCWTGDPFDGAIKEEKIYGRGSLDMKGGLACSMMAIKILLTQGVKLKGDLIFESVVDEESSISHGTLACIAKGYRAEGAIITEPNNMTISPCSLGGSVWRITVIGKSGMGFSGEEILEPVYPMGKVICAIKEYSDLLSREYLPPELFKDIGNLVPVRLSKLKAGELYKWGTPEDCFLEIVFTPWPGLSEEDFRSHFLGYMHRVIQNEPVLRSNPPKIESVSRYQPALEIARDHLLVKITERAYSNATGRAPVVRGAPFASDAYLFPLYGDTPAIIIGPGGRNAHTCDEYVNTTDLIELVRVLTLTIVEWCGVEGS
ncbi:MAG: M20/M25/M40 family metallo-hydrolase [Desulfobacteraceae bacterium]|nr:M20/M25/M40 family metallo-hydrolase [Desulfobacteraceae bacterium]